MKVLDIEIEENEEGRKCVVNASPFDFNKSDVVGILLGVLYTFSSCVDEQEEEGFIFEVLEDFANQILDGGLHAEAEVFR